jgi:hypothetical protein
LNAGCLGGYSAGQAVPLLLSEPTGRRAGDIDDRVRDEAFGAKVDKGE